ncbi:phage tail protein [Salibacterium lacus]|uniref:Phage tail tape measure protein n=1 Tax=Salibacterium lacus TaxID=1898109 RepID=A0ABW5SYB8_9BACI
MATLSEMSVKIGADTSGFEKGMQNAAKKMDSVGKGMRNVGGAMTKWVSGPMAGATAGLGALVGKTAQAGDEAAKNARKVGVSTEAYQEYQYALGQAGMSSEDTDKALGRLNQRMGQAAAGNEKYADALTGVGVNMEDVKNGSISTDEAMMQSLETLSGMENEQERAAAATELFGTKMAREMMPALEAGAGGIEDARKKAQELGIVIGDEAAQKSEAFNDKMEDLGARMKGLGQEIGSKLIPIIMDQLIPAFENNILPMFEKVGNKIVDVVDWFTNLSPQMQGVAAAGAALAAALGPMLVVLGSIVSAVTKITPLFTALGTVMGTVSAPVLAVVAAVAALAAGLVYLWNTNDDFREALISAWEKIKQVGMTVFNTVKDFLLQTWEQIQSETKAVWDSIKSAVQTVMDAISNIIETVWSYIQTQWDKYGEYILDAAKSIWDLIKTTIENAITIVSNIIQTVMNLISGDWETAWQNIKTIGQTLWDQIKAVVETAIDIVKNVIQATMKAIKNIIQSIWNAVKGVIQSVLNRIKNLISNAWNGISSTISSILNGVKSTISSIWNGIKNTISTVVNNIRSTISDIFNSLSDVVTSAMDNVSGAVKTGINNAYETITGIVSKFFDAGKNIVTSIADGIKSAMGKVTGAMEDMVSKARDFLPFSPAKEGPLKDLNKLNFGGPISDSILKDKRVIQNAMNSALTVNEPKMNLGSTSTPLEKKRSTKGADIRLNQTINGIQPGDVQRETQRALRRLATDFNV